ncbi:low molecular weight phosphotyrosine protein phosphatase [Actinomadura alba]|uniref:protein-tyrosine-phosphatase n=1 Tax=Actinomadura alba TaxID=406431 RepID=A0ABR7LNR3_9ACTN|nr:low molecular weight phosphotyrosine protein phosphatase [Actinomadura alba]MBC6466199.1 low molecular weight phosphotyrosine protein phosphatase [Actinomadura alba]
MAGQTPQGQEVPPGLRRILVVCLGNHCRSPFAAAVLARHGGAAVEVRSAGTRDKWVGKPAHPTMIAAAARCGYDLTGHRGVQADSALMEWADVILTMDRAILATLRELADARTVPKLTLYLDGQDVPDPWGQDDAAFAACAAGIESGATRHLR